MADIFVEREFDPPLTRDDVLDMAAQSVGCFGIYKVEWIESFLSLDGRKMFCHFSTPDVESLRLAFRQSTGSVPLVIWSGSIHDSSGVLTASVLVERSFVEPVLLDDIHAMEVANSWCLETRNVKHQRSFFARDKKRMLCLYNAPDAQAVREAQQQAGMPMDSAWAFDLIKP